MIAHRTHLNAKIQKLQRLVFLTTFWIFLNVLNNVPTEPTVIPHQKLVRNVQKDVQHAMDRRTLPA